MDENRRSFYDRFKDTVNAYVFHDPNAQANTAWDRVRKAQDVDEKSFQMFQESAEAGHPFACYSVGRCYENGTGGVEKDLAKAYEWFRKAAIAGDANAWVALARMFDKGIYVDRDPKEAAMWLERAAAKGHTLALIGMGEKCSVGDGVEKDPARALEYFQEAHKKDQRIASYLLGEAIGDGIGCEKNYEQAFEYFQEAHKNHFPPATFNVGMMLEMGLGCEKDEKRGFELIKQAADEDFPDAMYRVAFHYWEGTAPTGKSLELAFSYFKKAADLDFAPACVETGICYENGSGTEKSPEKAFEYYEKGTNLGFHAAIVCLAVCYVSGIGCEPNEAKARALLEMGVKLGNSRAYHMLALMLLNDDPYDERAINLEMVAANNHFARAALLLGGYFMRNHDYGPDLKRAEHYYRLADQENNYEATFELASLLDTEENRENEEVQKEIRELYERSANQGNHPLAAYRLALSYAENSDKEEEYTSIHYMVVAANGGIPEAAKEIAERMFWGDQMRVNLRMACGFYGFSGDELASDDLTAKAAYTRVLIGCQKRFQRIGCYDRRGRQIKLIESDEEVIEPEKTKEAFDKLSALVTAKNQTAMLYFPLAKVMFEGSDLSSDEDQMLISDIDDQPVSRDANYVAGILGAYLYPEKAKDTIETLLAAQKDFHADNVNVILGNIYYSLAHGGRKARRQNVPLKEGTRFLHPTDGIDKLPAKEYMQGKTRKYASAPELSNLKKARKEDYLETAECFYGHAYTVNELDSPARVKKCMRGTLLKNLLLATLLLCVLLFFFAGLYYGTTHQDFSFSHATWAEWQKCLRYAFVGMLKLLAVCVGIIVIAVIARLTFSRRRKKPKNR